MKIKPLLLALTLGATLLVGCGSKTEPTPETPPQTNTENKGSDAVSGASMATDEATLQRAMKESWIVIARNDITTSKELVMEGEFTKPDKNDATKTVSAGRKLALYDQDADKNKTASYTVTAPKLVIKSKDTTIKGGTFIGDVYVEAEGFQLQDAKVEGNVYFTKQEYKDSFKIDDKSAVTGATEVK